MFPSELIFGSFWTRPLTQVLISKTGQDASNHIQIPTLSQPQPLEKKLKEKATPVIKVASA